MVPEGWKLKTLEELTTKISDGIHTTPRYADQSPVYFVNGNNLKNGHIVIHDSTKCVDEVDAQKYRRELSHRTVLMSINGTIGNLAYYNHENVVLGKSACYINVDGHNDVNFLYYVLSSAKVQAFYTSEITGSTIKNLSLKTIKATKVETPPLPEQRKIAKILSTWDKAIATTENLIETNKQQKKALMQQLLAGKKRFEGFVDQWDTVKLSSLCTRLTEKNNGQSTNVVTISAKHGLIRQAEFFKKSIASETLDNYFILRKGQFAYNKSYSSGYPMGAIKRLNRYSDAVVTSLYICFEIKNRNKTSSCFMEHYFESGLLNNGLTKVAAEGGRAHGLLNVRPADFMNLTLTIPSYEEQKKIASVLTAVDREIENLSAKLAHFKQEKKALMQQLLTGKRRVKVETNNYKQGAN